MKFDWDKILQPKTVVHCPEEWMWEDLLKERLLEHPRGAKITSDYYGDNGYNFLDGAFSNLSWYKKEGWKILSYKEILLIPTDYYYGSPEWKTQFLDDPQEYVKHTKIITY